MKYIFRLISVIFAVMIVTACAATPGKVSETKAVEALNLQQGVALKGYDPVAYFAEGAPVIGDPAISYQWRGATWLFSAPAHREAFVADPAHYAPQYGGYCAFAVSRGTTADADPGQWAIAEGKLYVNNNAFAKKLWNQDRPANIEAGDLNWPLIPKFPVDSSPASAVRGSAPAASFDELCNNLDCPVGGENTADSSATGCADGIACLAQRIVATFSGRRFN